MPHTVKAAADTNTDAAAAANDEGTAIPPEQAADAIIGGRKSAASSVNQDAAASISGLASDNNNKDADDDAAGVKEAGTENINPDNENGEEVDYGVAGVEGVNENNSEQRLPSDLGIKMKREVREASFQFGIAMGRELAGDINDTSDAQIDSAAVGPLSPTPGQRIKMLTVSPGWLGISLAIVPEGGARIIAIDPACTFKGQVQVGDRIVTIDGKRVVTMEDVKVNRDRMRRFGIVRKMATITTPVEDSQDVSVSGNVATTADNQDVGAKQVMAHSGTVSTATATQVGAIIAAANQAVAALDNVTKTTALHAPLSPTKECTNMTSVVAELKKEITQLRKQNRKLKAEESSELNELRSENEKLIDGNAKLRAEVYALKLALQDEESRRNDMIVQNPPERQAYKTLENHNADGDDTNAEGQREAFLRELLRHDRKHNINTTLRMGPTTYQVLYIPLKCHSNTAEKPELNYRRFQNYNNQSKFFEKFLNAWAQYVNGSQEDAAVMILTYMAKHFPTCYVKNFDTATKKTEKIIGRTPPELPPGFVNYDGTNNVRWNKMYAELVKYKEEHGDCQIKYKVTALGSWVSGQRSARRNKSKGLTDKRIELLDELGFVWDARPENHKRSIRGGDPRENRAIAAKLVYPDLTMREALYLGGFEEEELNVIKDPKYKWRTDYILYRNKVKKSVENYEIARRTGARLEIEKLVNILRSENEDRFQNVFAEKSELVHHYLEAAEERRMNGTAEESPRKKRRKKNESQQKEEVYESENSDMEHEEQPMGEADVDFHLS